METKKCVECKHNKPLSHFDAYNRCWPLCRECRRQLDGWIEDRTYFPRRLAFYLWLVRSEPIYYRK